MTFRFSLFAACALPLILPAAAHAAPDADKAFQCAAIIQLTTANWPADHPSTAQASMLKADWLSFGKTLSFPKLIDTDAEVTAQISTIESTMISMMADPAGTKTYMADISQGCDAVPFTPLSPAVCKVYANAEKEASELSVAMQGMMAFHADTREKKIEIATKTREAEDSLAKAEAAMTYFSSAGEMTQDEAMDIMSVADPDARKARFETCLKQMG